MVDFSEPELNRNEKKNVNSILFTYDLSLLLPWLQKRHSAVLKKKSYNSGTIKKIKLKDTQQSEC